MKWAVEIQRRSLVIPVAAPGPPVGRLCAVQRDQKLRELNHQDEVIKQLG